MAAAKPPYDPVKTVEGMFNGSVTRIAYALKDPANYAQSTKAVLAETAKKFQDALDDCEIQILEAKWYLEHQLALNKARREAKAREESAAAHAKRKHDEIKDEQEKTLDVEKENAPKRVKTAEPEEAIPTQQPSQPPESSQPPPNPPATAPNGINKAASPKAQEKPTVAVSPDARKAQPAAAPPSKPQEKPPQNQQSKLQDKHPQNLQIPESATTQVTAEEFPKITPQDTPAGGNDDFNFVSMFGEPSGDNTDAAGNDMTFDLNLGSGFDADTAAHNMNVQDSSLNSLLPGLESYANQAGDDNNFNMGGNTNTGTSGSGLDIGAGMANDNNTQQQINVNDFSLPALGPNEFDDLLNSNDMNFDDTINLNDDGLMNMESMDMDFDSMFK